jgi:hypothetical protein
VRECPELSQRGSRIPAIRHDVGGEVVLGFYVSAFYPFHRCRPDRDFSIRQVHDQPRRACATVVAGDRLPLHRGSERAPQHEVHTHRERVELEYEMFPPGKDVVYLFALQPVDADAAIPADTRNVFARERP